MSRKGTTKGTGPPASAVAEPADRSRDRAAKRPPEQRLGRLWFALVVLALAAVAVIAIGLATSDGADDSSAPLVLALGEGDVTGSCLPFSVETLAGMPVAFAGAVTAVDDGVISLDVDRWYRGGDAATVELTTIADAVALLGGFPLDVGSEVLMTATDGAVNYCGYSGPAGPELNSAFDAAFVD